MDGVRQTNRDCVQAYCFLPSPILTRQPLAYNHFLNRSRYSRSVWTSKSIALQNTPALQANEHFHVTQAIQTIISSVEVVLKAGYTCLNSAQNWKREWYGLAISFRLNTVSPSPLKQILQSFNRQIVCDLLHKNGTNLEFCNKSRNALLVTRLKYRDLSCQWHLSNPGGQVKPTFPPLVQML